ncbi:MAG TPA: ATP-binding protein [Methanoculleus sp.]|nr:ATP-binding protein [Methanoculleus sp.]
MKCEHIPREARAKLLELAAEFPGVVVVGPRQSGKTTLVRNTFPEKEYVLLEDPDTRAFAEEDPRSFLAQFGDEGAILDEVQRVPKLFSYLQGVLDEGGRPGRFILTGSQNFLMMERISQTLAGRTGILKLLPFSLRELSNAGIPCDRYEDCLYQGMYPRLYANAISPTDFYSAYTQTYLERDLRQLRQVHDLSTFQTFIKMCAQRSGQVVNYSSLAADCGISHSTAREWISLLEASFILYPLHTHHKNYNKRLIKMPKLYFTDPGLAAYLAGIQDADQLAHHPLKGGLFETLIIGEFLKYRLNRAQEPALYFWRDRTGHEVDCLIEHRGAAAIPVEIKAGRTTAQDFFKNLNYYSNLAGATSETSFVVYGGDRTQKRIQGTAVSCKNLDPITDLLN